MYNAFQLFKEEFSTKEKLGIQAFAESILVIPKVLAENSGFDVQDSILMLADAQKKNDKVFVGIDILKEESYINPETQGIFDNYCVKRQFLNISPILAEQLLLVDEVISSLLI